MYKNIPVTKEAKNILKGGINNFCKLKPLIFTCNEIASNSKFITDATDVDMANDQTGKFKNLTKTTLNTVLTTTEIEPIITGVLVS